MAELCEAANLGRQRAAELIAAEGQLCELRVLEELGRYRAIEALVVEVQRAPPFQVPSQIEGVWLQIDGGGGGGGRGGDGGGGQARLEVGRTARWEGRQWAAERVGVDRAAAFEAESTATGLVIVR